MSLLTLCSTNQDPIFSQYKLPDGNEPGDKRSLQTYHLCLASPATQHHNVKGEPRPTPSQHGQCCVSCRLPRRHL